MRLLSICQNNNNNCEMDMKNNEMQTRRIETKTINDVFYAMQVPRQHSNTNRHIQPTYTYLFKTPFLRQFHRVQLDAQ